MSRILVVDDDADLRHLYVELLMEMGHRVVGAPDGVSALECAIWFEPELVLTDWRMPLMDGGELCQELRRNERLHGTRLILHSAEHVPEPWLADVCVPKICDPRELELLVHALLQTLGTDVSSHAAA